MFSKIILIWSLFRLIYGDKIRLYFLSVELIPRLKIVPQGLTVQEGDSAQFVCIVKSPRPTQITWSRREGKTLSERASVQGNVLRFDSLKISDGGSYVCTASNDFAVRTVKTLLVVKSKHWYIPFKSANKCQG